MHSKYKIALLAFLLSSCSKDFLNNTPKGFQLATTAQDYNNMLEEKTLSDLSDYTLGSGSFSPACGWAILGDDITLLYPSFSSWSGMYGGTLLDAQRLFSWSADVWQASDVSHELLGCYNRIYISNKIINEVLNATDGSDQQKKQYYAEGLANRAFNHFWALNLFGKSYDPSTAATDPGIPLVTTANAVQEGFTRSSVQACYDFIIKDLMDAIPDLPLVQTDANRFTKSAAEALLGKAYLFMGNFEDAKTQLVDAIADMPDHFSLNGTVSLINYNTAAQSPFPFGQYVFSSPGMPSPSSQGHAYPETLLARTNFSLLQGGDYFSGIMVSPETLSLFGSSDKRLALFSSSWGVADGYTGTIPFGLERVNAGNLGFSCGIQVPDIYLMSAEAKARTGDLAGATTDLVTLRKARMPAADAASVPTAQNDLIRFIIDERKREFCGFGVFRWHDMRRLNKDPLFSGNVYKHYVYDKDQGLTNTYTLDPERLTLRFPEIVLQQNPDMQQNP
jgi:hypothetical protein